jgi:hypothetical protein
MKHCIKVLGLLLLTSMMSGCQAHYNAPVVIAFGLILLIIALFLVLANYSNILRDEVSDLDEFNQNAQKLQQRQKTRLVNRSFPFSLSKVQFGVWTVIISSSYIYLALCKGDCAEGPINKTALVLMGIFAGTATASAIIDKREISDNRVRHQNSPSEGFFIDMLSDDNGISLHRFQNLVWTIIAMTIYINKVYNTTTGCVLPELSDTLLALTGISSATYLVLRAKENDPPVQEAQQTTMDDTTKKPIQTYETTTTTTKEVPKQPVVS